jgi:hypothetical protein
MYKLLRLHDVSLSGGGGPNINNPAAAGQAVLAEGAFVDGDKTKLDGIEALADVTDATNVKAAYDAATATLTNKTFDANGTGNSLSNVDVTDLATGTDGELITWDASGNPATVAAGTATHVLTSNGAGAAPTFQAAAGGGTPDATVLMPQPVEGAPSASSSYTYSGNTTASLHAIVFPVGIAVNKISIVTAGVTTASTLDFVLYSSDGQTQILSGTTASIASAATVYTTTLGAEVEVPAGVYYWGFVANDASANFSVYRWAVAQTGANAMHNGVSGKDVLRGTKTVTAGTLPATIDPTTDITSDTTSTPLVRFDN